MLTASVANNNIVIYTPGSITGVNTNLFFVFDNNSFRTISTASAEGNTLNVSLVKPVSVGGNIKINLYRGGISSSLGLYTTSVITAQNLTTYVDDSAPSLIEMIESGDFDYTSYVYSNFITGITTQANFPTASLTLKRQPPQGSVTINEGYLGYMRVHRFAALSSTFFDIASSGEQALTGFFTFDYNSYGNQVINTISLYVQSSSVFPDNSLAYISINEDYFGAPSQTIVGSSETVDLTGISSGTIEFNFVPPIEISEAKYWCVFTPSSSSSLSGNSSITIKTTDSQSYYSGEILQSTDGIVYDSVSSLGASFSLETERGIVLPTSDAIYNQLDQPQNIIVQYGDQSNYSSYTELAVPVTSHSIKKNLLDSSTVYAIESLIDSTGQNQFEIFGTINGVTTSYYTMISNILTSNIVRYELYTPQPLDSLKLTSLGDYYCKGGNGTVLISASDFLGITTVEISTSPYFPQNSTTAISVEDSAQQYIANVDYDFGDLGKKFLTVENETGAPIRYIYATNVSGVFNYLLISDSSILLYDNTTVTSIYQLTESNFTSSCLSSEGVILTDTLGVVYLYTNGAVSVYGTVTNVPISSATQITSTYIGVSTLRDTSSVQLRKRIYRLNNGELLHQSWSRQIPEPEITSICATTFGLIIGAYDQINSIGKIYSYYNSVLTLLYSTYLRPDFIYYSTGTQRLYVGFAGSFVFYAIYDKTLGAFQDTGVPVSGTLIKEIASTKVQNKIIAITDISTFIFDELTFATTQINSPSYSSSDQQGALITVGNLDLGIDHYQSTFTDISFSNVDYDPLLNGYTSNLEYTATGYIIFPGISTGLSTSFYVQYPNNSSVSLIKVDGQNVNLESNVFTQTFYPSIAKEFQFKVIGVGITGIGTIAIYNGISTFASILSVSNFVAPKNINWYLKTGGTNDLFGFSDGSLREADVSELASNQYKVYARFTDTNGITNSIDNLAYDIIYNQISQQQNNQALPSGRILEINPSYTPALITQYVPPSAADEFIFAGSKIARSIGVYESDPYFASDAVSWNQIQVLSIIPGVSTGDEHGTEVTLYVKTGLTLSDLDANAYISSYKISTIGNGSDYSSTVASILANISSFSGRWIKFKLELASASADVTPEVRSVLITYTGAGRSVFVTKTFDTSIQSTIAPSPKFRRGILTANFVTNGGGVTFGYTTDPDDGNPNNYTVITPNQIFTLESPSETIKFGVILKTATSTACFFDEFALQMDLGEDDVYFMPPQSAFVYTPYYNTDGSRLANAYQFTNKTVGIVSSYNWSFGTSLGIGILTYVPADNDAALGPIVNRQNPIVQFAGTSIQNIGLFVTGWIENGVVFNSDAYTLSFIST